MKMFFVLTIICILVVCANSAATGMIDPNKLQAYYNQCAVEKGLNTLDSIFDKPDVTTTGAVPGLPTKDERGCVVSCAFKKAGMVNEDGSYNAEMFLISRVNRTDSAEIKREFDAYMRNCTSDVGNECKMANCALDRLLPEFVGSVLLAIVKYFSHT